MRELDYRIFLRCRAGNIVGRADYVSEDDVTALLVGAAIFEICSDVARQYEVWRGNQQVATSGKSDLTNLLSNLPYSLQQIVVDTELAMRDSRWAVAESRQLLDKLKDWEAKGMGNQS